MKVHVEGITLKLKLYLKLQCKNQVNVILSIHLCILTCERKYTRGPSHVPEANNQSIR